MSDPTGGVVPGATVTVIDENKGFRFTTQTEQDGRYVFRNLAPGSYTLDATFAGVKEYKRPNVVLTVGQNAQATITFEVAGTQQTVKVSASAPLLQTQDASTGQLVNQKFINDLPLTSRSVFNLTQLAPGATRPPGGSFGLNQSPVNFVSNGRRNSTADIVMDGVSQTDQENNGGINTALYTPPVDAVEEVQRAAECVRRGHRIRRQYRNQCRHKVRRQPVSRQRVRVSADSDLNANNWFNNQNKIPIAPSKRNQFGGTCNATVASPGGSFVAPEGFEAGPGQVYVPGNVAQANLIHQERPGYPPAAKAAHVQGNVMVKAIIGTDGTAKELSLVSGPRCWSMRLWTR